MTEIMVGLAAFFVAGVVQGCTGFGMALVAAPCLMLVAAAPKAVVPLLIVMSMLSSLLVAFEARRHIRPSLVGPLVLGGVIGLRIGIYALDVIDATALKVFLGAFVVIASLVILSGWRKPIENPRWTLIPVGMVSGFFGGSTSMGGPPVILFLTSQDTPKDIFRGNIVCYFFVTNCFAIAMLLMEGMITRHVIELAVAFLPVMLLGTYVGVRLSRIVPEVLFRNVVMAGVAIVGVVLLASNIGEFRLIFAFLCAMMSWHS